MTRTATEIVMMEKESRRKMAAAEDKLRLFWNHIHDIAMWAMFVEICGEQIDEEGCGPVFACYRFPEFEL